MSEPKYPTPEEVVALELVRKERAKQQVLKPLPKWPLNGSFFFAVLFFYAVTPGGYPFPHNDLVLGGAFLGFAVLLHRHVEALTGRLNGLIEQFHQE